MHAVLAARWKRGAVTMTERRLSDWRRRHNLSLAAIRRRGPATSWRRDWRARFRTKDAIRHTSALCGRLRMSELQRARACARERLAAFGTTWRRAERIGNYEEARIALKPPLRAGARGAPPSKTRAALGAGGTASAPRILASGLTWHRRGRHAIERAHLFRR